MVNDPNLYTTLNTGAKLPLLGLGVYDMHNDEAVRAVRTALDLGYRLIDTAAMYENEAEIGRAIRESTVPREQIFLTTKVNNTDQGYAATLRAFDRSMTRLDCDYLDLYLVHWPLKPTRKETWLALEELYKEGRVRAVGVANYLVPFLEELQGYASLTPALNQVEFSPFLYLRDLLDRCRQEGIQLQAYTPLVRGQKFGDPTLLRLAEKYSKTPAQILLRWAIELGVSTIPKSASPERLLENFSIFDFSLDTDDLRDLAALHQNYRVVDDPMTLW